ncbi:MAG: TonB-dependent receptor family protein [Bacteroidota bacterium]
MKLFSQLTLIFLFSLSTLQLSAQQNRGGNMGQGMAPQGIVKGIVVDSKTNQGIEYANVVIFKVKDSTMVNGGITNGKGKFTIEKVPFGKYYAKVNFIGFAPITVPSFVIKPDAAEVDLGSIKLSETSASLKGADIVSERKTMEFKLDKKVVNVEKSLVSSGGTAVDVLQNVPSVTIDADGNLSLRGNSNITVLIDGRPSTLSGSSRQAILDQIPASSIETIELITNPSAKYQAEGMSGIINIKLKKKMNFGLNGTVNLNAGWNDKYNGSINLSYNFGKVNIFGSFDRGIRNSVNWSRSDRNTTLTDTSYFYHQQSNGSRRNNSAGYKLGADFFISSSQTLTLAANYNTNISTNKSLLKSTGYDSNHNFNTYSESNETEDGDNHTWEYTLNYRKNFKKKEQALTADVSFSQNTGNEINNTALQYFNTNYSEDSFPIKQNTNSQFLNNQLNAQMDYVHPFDSTMRIETGYKYSLRDMDQNYILKNFIDTSSVWINNPLLSNHFAYNEQVHALYLIFSKVFNKFSFQIGVRAELTQTKVDQITLNESFKNNYLDFFPSLHTTYKLGKQNEIQLSYSRRINRPDVWSLNPFVDYSNPLQIQYGNPYLKPEYINSIELGYAKYWKSSSLSTSIFYKNINDVIKRWSFIDSNGVTNMTSKNMTSGTSYGLEVVADKDFLQWWRMNLTGSYFRTIINGDNMQTNLTNDNYSWTMRANSFMTFFKKLELQLVFNYRGAMVTPQGTMNPGYNIDAALKMDIIKNKMSVGLRMSDIFNTQQFKGVQSGVGFSYVSVRKRESQILFLNFTYKIINNAPQKMRKKPQGNQGENGGGDEGF